MPDQFLNLRQASRRLGLSEPALRTRIRSGEIRAFRDPLNRRVKLVALSDLDGYATPRPIASPRQPEEEATVT